MGWQTVAWVAAVAGVAVGLLGLALMVTEVLAGWLIRYWARHYEKNEHRLDDDADSGLDKGR